MDHMPADLRRALAVTPASGALWRSLTPIARRDFVSWISSAKQPETRRRRVERVPDMLASGKRRPCCYAIVPMSLYKALAAKPEAKARWGGLAPAERRDFVDWIDAAGEAGARERRIGKACEMIARGKIRP
jgi:uncharacterized protein YdeI (YjbR/CyaY-like superfamily)